MVLLLFLYVAGLIKSCLGALEDRAGAGLLMVTGVIKSCLGDLGFAAVKLLKANRVPLMLTMIVWSH